MRELTVLYEGWGLVGRTTSIRQVASMLDGARYTLDQLREHAPSPRCVVETDELTLVAKSQTGPIRFTDIFARFRAEADAILVPDAPHFQSIAPRGIGVWDAFEAAAMLAAERRGLVTEVRDLLLRRRRA